MTTTELLAEITGRGLTLESDGTDLRLLGPRERMDPGLLGRIRSGKAALLTELGRPQGPATLLQRSYLLGRQGVPGEEAASHVYHEFTGSWDLPQLERSLNRVVGRHDCLHTRFTEDGGRVLGPPRPVPIVVHDLRSLAAEDRDVALRQARHDHSHRVLPVDGPPLLAVSASLVGEREAVLHVGHDGLAMDGISMFLFFREWLAAYREACRDADHEDASRDGGVSDGDSGPPAEDMPSFDSYVEAVERLRSGASGVRSRARWLERLDLAPHPELPMAPEPAGPGAPRFTPREIRLDAARWGALRDRAHAEGVTPTTVLLSAYAEALSFWGADRSMTINTTLAVRPPIHPSITRSIGQYSDVLLVEVDLDPELDVRGRVRALQDRLRLDLDDRHFSGLEVLRELYRRGAGRTARMPYTFNSTLGYPDAGVSGSALSAFGHEVYTVSQTPQVWLNVFVMEQDGALVVQVDMVDDVFPPGLPDAFVEGYRTCIELMLDDATWTSRTVDLLPAAQRRRRAEINATGSPVPVQGAHESFLRHAARQPDAPAVMTAGGVLTYGELARRAGHAACWLREQGVGRDELVGLVMRRGPGQLVGMLATAIAGGAYLPVDADLPAARREFLLRDGRVRCVLTDVLDAAGGFAGHVLDIDEATGPAVALPPPLPGSTAEDLLYVIYTSGTTGDPKGVMVSHRSVVNLVTDCTARFAVTAADRFFGISAFNFDLSVFDVFGALSAGACVVLPDHDRAADPAHWLDVCGERGVTVWNSVPAIVEMLAQQAATDGVAALAALRLVMMSGDRIPPATARDLRRLLPDAELVSLGGPTETTVWNILHPITDDDTARESIPYGRPNANNRCHILDDRGRERPDWVPGEICAAGTGLARGYWGDPERTASRFSHHTGLGTRIYRTGDLGYLRPDGDVAIMGRTDFQIKINGYRVEAGEVESRLVGVAGVAQAAVVRQDGAVGARLVAHLVTGPDRPGHPERPADGEIRTALREMLPEYMVPSVFVWHERLPLTANGKVDRGALTGLVPAPVPPATDGAAMTGPLQQELATLWGAVLGTPVSDVDTSFFELGGDSLAAARVLTGVRRTFGAAIALDQFHLVETVRTMAQHIGASELVKR